MRRGAPKTSEAKSKSKSKGEGGETQNLPKIEQKASGHRHPVLLFIKKEKEKGGEGRNGRREKEKGEGGGTDKVFVCPPPLLAVAWLAFLL